MAIIHLNGVLSTSTAALVKPTKEPEFKNPEEGYKPVLCKLCEKSFEKMKSLYYHLKAHSDADWKTFFMPPPPPPKTAAVDKEAEVVVDSVERAPLKWMSKGKRGREVLEVDYEEMKLYKVPFKGERVELWKFNDEELEAANALMELRYGRHSVIGEEKKIEVEGREPEGGFKFDLNQPPPID